ncbi:MAG TPA: hypothetical protein VIS99_07455, partial [Terrimicrobiaceae bacterium]
KAKIDPSNKTTTTKPNSWAIERRGGLVGAAAGGADVVGAAGEDISGTLLFRFSVPDRGREAKKVFWRRGTNRSR